MTFEPIAIVGRACLLPGADDPQSLWHAARDGADLLSAVDPDRWGVARRDIMVDAPADDEASRDRSWCDRGGYVRGFNKLFKPTGFALPAEEVRRLDPLVQWVLHVARQALQNAAIADTSKTGAVVGNLSFPSEGMSRYAARHWLGGELADAAMLPHVDARNRFMSGLPAHLLAQALNLGDAAYCLDAACASSLVALKLACDRLHDRAADVMLAGAVSRADDLFIHVGFCALKAMSPSAQSRPFHRDADGLLPAEGAGMLVLQRLADAERDGRHIYGVIRGIGVSNDGRGKGLLAPNAEGQERAMKSAYEVAGIAPDSIDYVECHATGTPTGDQCELRSMSQVFARDPNQPLPIGSFKGNLGHLITAAGVASLIKVLGAMEEQLLPPTVSLQGQGLPLLDELGFRVVEKTEPWRARDAETPRRAAVSAFGFGGNNAHVILEEYRPAKPQPTQNQTAQNQTAQNQTASSESIAVVALNKRELQPGEEIALPIASLRFPPSDLQDTLPQQLLMLAVAEEALAQVAVPAAATGVFVGMGCDPNVARYGARWRLPAWARHWGMNEPAFIDGAKAAFIAPLKSAGVLGTMPNIVANRLNSSFDLRGGSLTVSAEELSGVWALQLACRALRAGEIDAALVGAVDCCRDSVHEAALRSLGQQREGADAAVVLVVMRESDARTAGHPILARLPADNHPGQTEADTAANSVHAAGHGAHAAAGLIALHDAMRNGYQGGMTVSALGGQQLTVTLQRGDADALPANDEQASTSDGESRVLRFPGSTSKPVLPQFISKPVAQLPEALEPQNRSRQALLRAPQLQRQLPADSIAVPIPEAPPMTASAAPSPSANESAAVRPVAATSNAPSFVMSRPQSPKPTSAASAVAADQTFQSSASASVSVASYAHSLMSAAAQQRTQLAQLHQQFLAQQASVHQHFIESRSRQQQLLLDAAALSDASPLPQVIPTAPQAMPLPSAAVDAAVETPVTQTVTSAAATLEVPVQLPGFQLDRQQLMIHASGNISEIFGAGFSGQDGYARQVRMPCPPLLLADRMTGIDAEPNVLGTGTIWTETDVHADAWYMHRGRMPAGLMIESGQADLMLISYMGIDHFNQSDRVYRLLGCELTYHASLPQPGETLAYDIHVDGHAEQGDVRLFFFHYDCRVNGELRLSVRHGQAGFFSDEELADSAGVLWDAAEVSPCDNPHMELPSNVTQRRSFDEAQVKAFAAGNVMECFGAGFEKTCTHTRSPGIATDRMLFIDEVTDFDPQGGPWGRGYLRAVDTIEPDDWFFEGHFHNDPCMPGTLMFDGCLQTMAFYLAALGYSCDRDGWRFEPLPGEAYKMRCRGQVLPTSKNLVYEVFVEEVVGGDYPTLYADLLCTIDGRKAFHCQRMALRMVPDWPMKEVLANNPGMVSQNPAQVASYDGFKFDHTSLLACAWGPPSHAFGPIYDRFDSPRSVARLPSPPYHFMTRITHADGRPGNLVPDQTCVVDYDIPEDAWYFNDNGARVIPYCVLLEAALQPCGWLASYVGSALSSDTDLAFRNLDGTSTLHCDLPPDCGTLTTRSTITNISSSAGMIIESFEVTCHLGDVLVYEMSTVFGFFPQEALENQSGMAIPKRLEGALEAASERQVDLETRPPRYCNGSARLSTPFLLMIDRVTGIWPDGGEAGLGRYRAEKDIEPEEWFLKAHFFQDPVQPGSLGIEAMIQLLQFAMLDRDMDKGLAHPRFESIALGKAMTWKYRGQVRVRNRIVHTVVDITETGEDESGRYAIASASLYVDGMRIYEASNLGMRIVAGEAPTDDSDKQASDGELHETLDPNNDRWLNDHCPTFTVPALPMMSMLDRLAAAAQQQQPQQRVIALDDVQVARWLPLAKSIELVSRAELGEDGRYQAVLSGWREAARAELSRFEPVASGTVTLAESYPSPDELAWAALEPLQGGTETELPYASGQLFHGPAFHKLVRLIAGANGSSAWLDAEPGAVPVGTLNQVLLDAATHGIPHDRLAQWDNRIGEDLVAYPYRIGDLQLFSEAPTRGVIRCEARYDGIDDHGRLPRIRLYLFVGDRLWLRCVLTEILLPKGPLGAAPPELRQAFLRDRQHVEDMALSRLEDGSARLAEADIKASNWLPGTIEEVYQLDPSGDAQQQVLAKDYVGQMHGVHPSAINLVTAGARLRDQPLLYQPLHFERESDDLRVTSAGAPRLDLAPVEEYWAKHFNVGRWPVEDLYYGLIRRFVRSVQLQDGAAFEAAAGRSMLYLANHQVAIESLLFSIIVSGLSRVPTVTLAKEEHRHTWLGLLIKHCFSFPDVVDPQVITYFDRSNPSSLAEIIGDLAKAMMGPGKSVMVHIEGTRSLSCTTPVIKMTSAFIDMALHTRAPIVPVRFVGGLPREPLAERIEFPLGMGKQDIYIGRPIEPEVFEALPYKERKAVVIEQINALGPNNADEQTLPGDPHFAAMVESHRQRSGASEEHSTLWQVLRELHAPGESVQRLLLAEEAGKLELNGSSEDRWLAELARRLWGENFPVVQAV